MTNPRTRVSEHYTVGDLGNRILGALAADGKDLNALSVDDLAPVDAFHIRGRAATEELAGWARIESEHLLLDAGCGIGGTSRYLAATTGCEVVGVDLTEEYCRIAEMLSGRVGLSERTAFRPGSVLDLPFDDAHFDVVWTEHVQMNIADKIGFYSELGRVLKPGGQLAFHDIFAGEGVVHFPVPWATNSSISHLLPVPELESLLGDVGFARVRWEEKTEESKAFFHAVLERVRSEGWLPVGLHLLMDEPETRLGNVLRNLEEERIRVIQAVVERAG